MAISKASDPLVLFQLEIFAVWALRAGRIPFATGATFGRSGCEQIKQGHLKVHGCIFKALCLIGSKPGRPSVPLVSKRILQARSAESATKAA